MIKAVIFDLDGTIGDTMPLIIRSFRDAIEPYAKRSVSDEEIIATFGRSEEGTIRMMIPDDYDAGFAAFIRSYSKNHKQFGKPFGGITELLNDLKSKNLKLGIVTGKGPVSYEITMREYGYENMFDAIDTGIPEGPRKPEGLRAVLKALDIEPHETVYIGDMDTDITASREVGIPPISAAWADTAETEKLRQMNPYATFESVRSLSDYLNELAAQG